MTGERDPSADGGSDDHPTIQLLHALNNLAATCQNARLFGDLQKMRDNASDLHIKLMNLASADAQRRADERVAKGETREAASSEFDGLYERGIAHPKVNVNPGFIDQLRETLSDGAAACRAVADALERGGSEVLDAAVGAPRGIQIGVKLEEATSAFLGLEVALPIDAARMDDEIRKVAELREYFGNAGNELRAVLKQRTLPPMTGTRGTAPTAAASPPTPPDRMHLLITENPLLSASELAARFGVDAEALRKRLERARARLKLADGDFVEPADPRVHEPRYLYRVAAALPYIRKLLRRVSDDASDDRPTTEN